MRVTSFCTFENCPFVYWHGYPHRVFPNIPESELKARWRNMAEDCPLRTYSVDFQPITDDENAVCSWLANSEELP